MSTRMIVSTEKWWWLANEFRVRYVMGIGMGMGMNAHPLR